MTLTEAKYNDGYRLWIKFSDGMSGVVDSTDIIPKFPAASPLGEKKRNFRCSIWMTGR